MLLLIFFAAKLHKSIQIIVMAGLCLLYNKGYNQGYLGLIHCCRQAKKWNYPDIIQGERVCVQ